MPTITFSKMLVSELPESLIDHLEQVSSLSASIVDAFTICSVDPSIFELDANTDMEEALISAYDMSPGPDKKRKLAQLRLKTCFDEKISGAVNVLGSEAKKSLYKYLATADHKKLTGYYMSLANHTVNLLISAIKRDLKFPTPTPSYLLIGHVDNVPRIYMSCTPGLGADANIQEHMYIFRDPIPDLFDIFNEKELVKGLALQLHLYGISEFKPTYLTTSPLKVMDDLLSTQPFLEPVECPPPGCPRKYFFGRYNTRMWKINTAKI